MKTLVIAEKASQARDIRAAVGDRHGPVLPAEGHLLRLAEPEEVDPAWKRWSFALLKPDGLYPTKPDRGGGKAAKLAAIRQALKGAARVIIATDCDREGQLIGQEILEHLRFKGEVLRAIFTAQDPTTLRKAFANLRPEDYFEVVATAAVAGGSFELRHAPPPARRIKVRARAEAIAALAEGFRGPLAGPGGARARPPPPP